MAGKKRQSTSRKKGSRTKKRSKRTRGGFGVLLRTWLGVMAACALLIGAYILLFQKGPIDSKVSSTIDKRSSIPAEPPKPSAQPPARVEVTLFFGDSDAEYLVPEARRIPRRGPDTDLARAVMKALIEGPSGGLQPTIPRGTRLREISIDQGGICTVDFNSAFLENHPGGSSGELLTVYSIIETLTTNVPRIDAVQILVDGKPRETLAGHLYIGEPLRPNSKYVQRKSS